MDSPGRRRLTTLSNKFLSAVTRFSTWFKSCVGKTRVFVFSGWVFL